MTWTRKKISNSSTKHSFSTHHDPSPASLFFFLKVTMEVSSAEHTVTFLMPNKNASHLLAKKVVLATIVSNMGYYRTI